jgi:hypothetical protein
MREEMTNVQRVRAILNFQPFDRLPVVEWAPWWDKTIERWRGEGLPAGARTHHDISAHFGLDSFRMDWFRARGGALPKEPRHGAGILADEADYERLREHLVPWPAVDRDQWLAWKQEQDRGESVLWFATDGYFWTPRLLLGIERHLYAFYDQPGLLHRICGDLADWHERVFEEVCRLCRPDYFSFAEDMSYNHGPMLSREMFDEFLAPYYRRVLKRAKDLGLTVFVDSDGDITVPAGWFWGVGVDGLFPLERQSGLDVAVLRRMHPRLRLLGAFDKMTMTRGREAMEREFERLLPVARQGGFIVSVDHQTPPGVSYAQYKVFLEAFWKYARLAGEH